MSALRTSFTRLVERNRTEILCYLVRLLGNQQDAQDACQEAFLRAQRAFGRLGPGANQRAWLYRIATNSGLTVARRRSRQTAPALDVDVDTLPGCAAGFEERERLRAVARAVGCLPPRQRAALMLRRFHGLSYAEIASRTGGNAAGARANVYQAIKKLRAACGGE